MNANIAFLQFYSLQTQDSDATPTDGHDGWFAAVNFDFSSADKFPVSQSLSQEATKPSPAQIAPSVSTFAVLNDDGSKRRAVTGHGGKNGEVLNQSAEESKAAKEEETRKRKTAKALEEKLKAKMEMAKVSTTSSLCNSLNIYSVHRNLTLVASCVSGAFESNAEYGQVKDQVKNFLEMMTFLQ